jgi:hypothetical protein
MKHVLRHHFNREKMLAPKGTAMSLQIEILSGQRAIIVDWIAEVNAHFEQNAETLFLAVAIIDRFLEKVVATRKNGQLVGAVGTFARPRLPEKKVFPSFLFISGWLFFIFTAILVASKYEEVHCPTVSELVEISDNTCTTAEILDMEVLMLQTLNFQVTAPTAHTFLMHFLPSVDADTRASQLALYHTERMLQEYDMVKYMPSVVAAAAVVAAMTTLKCTTNWVRPWAYVFLCQYTPSPFPLLLLSYRRSRLSTAADTPGPSCARVLRICIAY